MSDVVLIGSDDPLAETVTKAIQGGDVPALEALLTEHKTLSRSAIHDAEDQANRSLLHLATDWPGNFPNVVETIRLLLAEGADPNLGIKGRDTETPLHWAASSNDVAAVDALIDGGADLNAQGAVIAGGDPLEDAIGFQNWDAAERLVARGATTVLGDEAALGLMDRIEARFEKGNPPSRETIVYSFWNACCAGKLDAAQYLLARGADVNWVPAWCKESPLDGALKSENEELVLWLRENGAIQNAS